jgi:hypothetical protein
VILYYIRKYEDGLLDCDLLNIEIRRFPLEILSCSNDVEFKLAKFLQFIVTVKRTIFKKVITKTVFKLYNTLILPTFLYGSENWTLRASQRRIEAAEMKLLRPLVGYTL